MRKLTLAAVMLAAGMSVAVGAQANSYARLVGNVYVQDNNPNGNAVVFYGRFSNGALRNFGSVSTGGLGAGDNAAADALGGQDSVILSENERYLYVANAGSDEISVFYLARYGRPILIQRISSAGDFPMSLTTDGDYLYVLNAGSDGSIAGFDIDKRGRLTPLDDSVRSLGTGQVGPPVGGERNIAPGDIAFDRLNRNLVIPFGGGVELGDGRVLTFSINDDGTPSEDFEEVVALGRLPFSVDFTENGIVLVADALGPEAGDPASGNIGGGLSSYDFTGGATLSPVNTVGTGQIETCWVRTGHVTDFVYTTSTAAGAISSYTVSRTGEIEVLDPVAASDITLPIDFDLTKNDRYLYVTTGEGTVEGYRVNRRRGSLRLIGQFGGLPVFDEDGFTPQGLAVR